MPMNGELMSPYSPTSLENQNAQAQDSGLLQNGEDGSSGDDKFSKTSGSPNRTRLSALTSRAKAKTRKLIHPDGAAFAGDSDTDEGGVLDGLERNAAFHTSDLVKKKRFRPGKTADKTLNNIKSLGKAVVHPVDSIKSKATRTTAGQLSKAERPFLSQNADKEYLEAHDNLKRAESTGSSKRGTSDEDQESTIGDHREKLREIEAHRESLQVAWTTSRHIRRARVVPKHHIDFPKIDSFIERDEYGKMRRIDWLKWLGHNLLYYTQDFSAQYIDDFDKLPFDINSCRLYAERLVMASAPWQSWAMDVRAVYRWENPWNTARWFGIYLVLWYTQHMMGFFYGYIIYLVLKNRYFPTSVDSIRASMQKALDSQGTASQFSELIDRHGRHDWLEPALDHIGPYAQLQVGDMANMLEVFSNFYHWKRPEKTAATLFFFTSCLLVSIFADMAFCMKVFWFIAGGSFFLCWPIGSLYPKYRYLVSPFKWVLWDVPTNPEWSFQYLRRQAQVKREQMIRQKVEEGYSRELASPTVSKYTGRMITVPKIQIEGDESANGGQEDEDDGWWSASSSVSILEASDIRSFRAQSHGSIGRLIVSTKGIRYVRSLPKKEVWTRRFLEIAELRKCKGPSVSKLVSSPADQLEIESIDGSKLQLGGMKERDEAFNIIIAFSTLQWQSLQPKSNTSEQA